MSTYQKKDLSEEAIIRRVIYGQRINNLIQCNGESKKEVAKKLGITSQHLSRIICGEIDLTEAFICKFLKLYGETQSFILDSAYSVEELKAIFVEEYMAAKIKHLREKHDTRKSKKEGVA